MIKKIIFIFLLLSYSCYGFCQITFTKTYGGYRGYSVKQTNDGGYIVAGRTAEATYYGDVFLIRTDSVGDTLWTRTFGGSEDGWGYDVQQTNDGGYIVAGSLKSLWCFSFCTQDFFIIKTDVNGVTLWTKTGDINGAINIAYSIQQTVDSGYIMAGFTNINGYSADKAFLAKLNTNGDTLWTKKYANNSFAYSVQQTYDGGYVFTGETGSPTDIYLVKTDSAGNVVWAKTFYGGKQYDAVGMSVQQTVDSGYVVGGYVRFSNNDLTAAYLIKTDKNGDSLWAKTYDGALYDNAFSVQQTNDGGYIVAGQTKSFGAGMNDAWLIKTDANGDTLWTKTYGRSGNDVARSVQQTTDGGYIITGQTDGYGVWLIKTDSMGNAPPLKLSVSEVSTIQINFRVYPNPTTDGVTIDLGGEYKKTSIEITNINGEQISKTNYINARLIQLNVDAPTGVYLITVVSDSVVSTVKLVKE